MLDTMAGQDEVCTKLMVLKVLNQPNPQVNNFSPSKKAWIRPQDGIKMIDLNEKYFEYHCSAENNSDRRKWDHAQK